MIYFVGGAPRVGKTILAQQVAARLGIGWISTDALMQMLRLHKAEGLKSEWDASPEAIALDAERFFPYLERFVWAVNSLADHYLIEGVDFLPAQLDQLKAEYPIRSVFLGCSGMTVERFDQFPGHSPGYARLPAEMRRQFAQDVPRWSDFVRQEAGRSGYPYIDMSDDFFACLDEAGALLSAD